MDDDEESSGPYTCMRCLCGTWNDCDICDECMHEALSEDSSIFMEMSR